ncbi:MAG TPA: hypothetical protein P5571_10655 [Candidatus Krumholzibacteria bacterium]|nr:hypothetical protein [Candidatus Krumholzibacteria bacterium]
MPFAAFLLADLLLALAGGGQHALHRDPSSPDAPPYSCWLHVPAEAAADPAARFPLLLFLHGSGERGDSLEDPSALDRVCYNGPPLHLQRGDWQPPAPMIVLSPQSHTEDWEPQDVRALLEWADARLPVDRSRIYLTGLSRGGYGVWNYLAVYGGGAGDPLAIAAAAPICGGPTRPVPQPDVRGGTPLWAFHGEVDDIVPPSMSVDAVLAVAALDPVEAPRLTILPGVNHGSWVPVYAGNDLGSGMAHWPENPAVDPLLVPYSPDLYTWLLAHRR